MIASVSRKKCVSFQYCFEIFNIMHHWIRNIDDFYQEFFRILRKEVIWYLQFTFQFFQSCLRQIMILKNTVSISTSTFLISISAKKVNSAVENSLIAHSNLYLDHSSHDMFAFFPYSHQKTFFSSVYPYVPERIVWTNDIFQYLKSSKKTLHNFLGCLYSRLIRFFIGFHLVAK